MVGHQFYTHLTGVPVQVIKHSPSATYISHLYNCWPCHSLPTFLLLQATFSAASVHLEICKNIGAKGRRREHSSFLFTFVQLYLFTCIYFTHSSFWVTFHPSLIHSLFCLHFIQYSLIHLKNVVIAILVGTETAECLNKLIDSVITIFPVGRESLYKRALPILDLVILFILLRQNNATAPCETS